MSFHSSRHLVGIAAELFADVASQSNIPGWTLGKWAEYYDTEPEKRDKIRNVISLEISGTELAGKVLPPRLVRDVDWVEKFWPHTKKGRGHAYPKVQLYCLMGVADAWTVRCFTVTLSFVLLDVLVGLAHRLCRLICLLSHTTRFKGVFNRGRCIFYLNIVRSSTLFALLPQIWQLTSDGQGPKCKTIPGWEIYVTRSSR